MEEVEEEEMAGGEAVAAAALAAAPGLGRGTIAAEEQAEISGNVVPAGVEQTTEDPADAEEIEEVKGLIIQTKGIVPSAVAAAVGVAGGKTTFMEVARRRTWERTRSARRRRPKIKSAMRTTRQSMLRGRQLVDPSKLPQRMLHGRLHCVKTFTRIQIARCAIVNATWIIAPMHTVRTRWSFT
jgi:hypothetical protein